MTESVNNRIPASFEVAKSPRWWKEATVYQIYPASFKDTTGSGKGDLAGITQSLNYIKGLGADTIWISPIFESPQIDIGYDISDYEKVDPKYGTIEDVEELVRQCHQKGLRIVLDLVVNHTSDQHRWFIESRSSRDNPKHDWYHWHDGKVLADGTRVPPNNWRSNFGGSAWEWDDHRGQYYLHLFAKEMPDVNWRCSAAREAIYASAMRFWLDKGIDGFRIDTMTIYSKPEDYPDAPVVDPSSPWQPGWQLYRNHSGVFEIHSDMYDKVWSKYGDLLLVGEYGNTSNTDIAMQYCSAALRRVGMGFQFESVCVGYGMCDFEVNNVDLTEFEHLYIKWQRFIEGTDGWTSAFFENHDLGRSVSRFTSDHPEHRTTSAKMMAVLLATCTGTLFLYQGQELGMVNIPDSWSIDEFKDINTQRYWASLVERGASKAELQTARTAIGKVARDHGRIPMQWSTDVHAGFTTGKPWMRVHDNYPEVNVASEADDPDSVLNFWKSLLILRKQNREVFIYGSVQPLGVTNKVLSYIKQGESASARVVLNFSDQPQPRKEAGIPRVCNVPNPSGDFLQPFEARIYL